MSSSHEEPPVVLSICVPVFNEAATLAAVLDLLLSLHLPFAYEVIAVDDGSSDGSRELLESIDAARGDSFAPVRGDASLPSAAQEAAAGSALTTQQAAAGELALLGLEPTAGASQGSLSARTCGRMQRLHRSPEEGVGEGGISARHKSGFITTDAPDKRTPTSARLRVLFHDRNLGKSAALSTAIAAAAGRVIAIQDADLEYDPDDFRTLVEPILDGRCDAAFGSRYLPRSRRGSASRLHTFANRFLTTFSNLFTALRLTDMETCRKVFRRDRIGPMPFRAKRFAVEPEICGRLAWNRCRILEFPISYDPRNRAAGKKIGWRDALEAVLWIVRGVLSG